MELLFIYDLIGGQKLPFIYEENGQDYEDLAKELALSFDWHEHEIYMYDEALEIAEKLGLYQMSIVENGTTKIIL